jgi:hypothetical protein
MKPSNHILKILAKRKRIYYSTIDNYLSFKGMEGIIIDYKQTKIKINIIQIFFKLYLKTHPLLFLQ